MSSSLLKSPNVRTNVIALDFFSIYFPFNYTLFFCNVCSKYIKDGAGSENLGGQVVIWRAAAAWEILQPFQNLVGVGVHTGSL